MKKSKFYLSMIMLFTMSFVLGSCSNDDDEPPTAALTVTLQSPIDQENVTLDSALVTLTNVQTNQTYQLITKDFAPDNGNFRAATVVPVGTYNVAMKGKIHSAVNGVDYPNDVQATSENVAVAQSATGSATLTMNLSLVNNPKGGLVIEEIFFTGTLTPEGNQYSSDQFIKITNNSDEIVYADSVAVLESTFTTVDKQDYTPDKMNEAFTVDAVYMIPGTGKSVPVKPHQSLVLALNAKDHKKINTNSFDLSKADYEFYDQSKNPKFADEDNKATNLDKWYCYTYTLFSLHNRGFHAYAIAKMQGKKEEWLKNNNYTYKYLFTFGDFSKEMTRTDGYFVPNSWILDAVDLSIADSYKWQVTAASLDAGWAHCGSVDHDKNRYGKSVIRKRGSDGRLIDTNNSTNDFQSDAACSYL